MYQRALQGKENALGPDHTSTLNTVNNLGIIYDNQGKLREAEEMYQRALQGKENALGPDHTSTLNTVNNLGILYDNQGKLREAEEMYQRALQGYENALGPDHTSTLDTLNNLGILYTKQGKLAEAEKMYQRALQGKRRMPPQQQARVDILGNSLRLGSNDTSTLSLHRPMPLRPTEDPSDTYTTRGRHAEFLNSESIGNNTRKQGLHRLKAFFRKRS